MRISGLLGFWTSSGGGRRYVLSWARYKELASITGQPRSVQEQPINTRKQVLSVRGNNKITIKNVVTNMHASETKTEKKVRIKSHKLS
jgi:hypothetical protein